MAKRIKTKIGVALLSGLCIFTSACTQTRQLYNKDGGQPITDTTAYEVKCSELLDTSIDREAWLTVRDSVLVVNPFDYKNHMDTDERQSTYFNRENLSFDMGVLDSLSNPKKLTNIFGMASKNAYGGYLWANEETVFGTRPDRLTYEAKYDNGCELSVSDYFYDEYTVVRITEGNAKQYAYWGSYAAGNMQAMSFDEESFVYRTSDGIVVGIGFSSSGEWKFYDTLSSFEKDDNAQDKPSQSGIWCFTPDFTEKTAGAVVVGKRGENAGQVKERAVKPFKNNDFVQALSLREKEWNGLLNKVPRPQEFSLPTLESYNVTAENIELYYYRSWVQVISNVLPANDRFAWRGMSAGKSSMWAEGSPENKYSCIWESLFGTQMYSFIDADIAWELCLGSILNIPSDGNIQGESLPSNKAETVWICYQAKPDKEKLRSCVEPLTAYLNWRYENPRWILNSHNYIDEKDADFVSSYLVDLKFMRKICEELELTEQKSYWEQKGQQLYEDSLDWFFLEDGIVQYYYTEDGRTSEGTPLWINKYLWTDEIEGETLNAVLDFTISQYNPELAFVGFAGVKYDSFAYTTYGLLRHGRADIAADFVQACMRDIVRSGFIGELYNANGRGVVCEGVRPSLFGAIIMIDSVWLRNGFMFHEGGITAVDLFDDGGVSGITLNGKTYSVSVNGQSATISVAKEQTIEFGLDKIKAFEL